MWVLKNFGMRSLRCPSRTPDLPILGRATAFACGIAASPDITADAHHYLCQGHGVERWERVGAYVAAWRRMRGYRTQAALAAAAGLSPRTISSIEGAYQNSYQDPTLEALERALGWLPGSVASILMGGEPETVGKPLDKDLAALINVWDKLPESTQRIIRLIAESDVDGPPPS